MFLIFGIWVKETEEKHRDGPSWLQTKKTVTHRQEIKPPIALTNVEKLEKKCNCAQKQRASQCPVTQHYHTIFSFTDVLNQARPIWFSPQGVSFESFSSISRKALFKCYQTGDKRDIYHLYCTPLFTYSLKRLQSKTNNWYYHAFIYAEKSSRLLLL